MAVKKVQNRKINAIRLMSKADDAIDQEESDWDEYYEDPIKNEKLIIIKEGQTPTIFLCNFELTARQKAKIKDSLIKGVDPEDKGATISYGKYQHNICRMTLKAIENPPGAQDVIEYKQDGEWGVSDRTMNELSKAGIVEEIATHYQTLASDKTGTEGHEKNL